MPDELALSRWAVPLDEVLTSRKRERRELPDVAPAVAHASGSSAQGTFTRHPRYRAWLARCGVVSADTALSLAGEVVSGHPDRHVVRVELSPGRVAYLKREHVAGWKHRLRNRLAGFGMVSRSEREAKTLAALEAAGLPGPQWLAFGEDSAGRGFVLVDALPGSLDLRAHLDEYTLTSSARRRLAERVGTAVGELHSAGFGTPDLAAKHVLVSDTAVSVIDWPTAPTPGRVRVADVVKWLGKLNAGVPAELFPVRDRLRVFRAYRRAFPTGLRFGFLARAVDAAGKRQAKRPCPPSVPQPLVWVAGEEVVAIPQIAADWPTPAVGEPFYSAAPPGRERIELPSGRPAVLVRFRTVDPLGRLVAAVRERPWRSPASVAARILFHLQRHGLPAPALLAFGQKMTSPTAAESFVLADLPPRMVSLPAFLAQSDVTPAGRAAVLVECGRLLKRLHDAGLRPVFAANEHDPLFGVTDDTAMSVLVASPFAVRLAKRMNRFQREADLRRFAGQFDGTTGGWVRGGYAGAGPA